MELTDRQNEIIMEILQNYLSEDLAETIMGDIRMELENEEE